MKIPISPKQAWDRMNIILSLDDKEIKKILYFSEKYNKIK